MQFSIRTLLYLTLYWGVLFAWLRFCYFAFPYFWIVLPPDFISLPAFGFAFYFSRQKEWPLVRGWIVLAFLLILAQMVYRFVDSPNRCMISGPSVSAYEALIVALQEICFRGCTYIIIPFPIICYSIGWEHFREVFFKGKWEWASVLVGMVNVSLLLGLMLWAIPYFIRGHLLHRN